jgi:ankyrin repeat protein
VISTGRAEDNATPLHIATQYGHKDVIRALLVSDEYKLNAGLANRL